MDKQLILKKQTPQDMALEAGLMMDIFRIHSKNYDGKNPEIRVTDFGRTLSVTEFKLLVQYYISKEYGDGR
jgi:hypothetical protein